MSLPPAFVKYQGRRVYIPPHPTDCCPEKTWFETEIAARMGAQAALSRPTRVSRHARLWVYPCARCQGWHLTSSPNERAAVTLLELIEGGNPFTTQGE